MGLPIRIGAMVEIPVALLTKDYKQLLASLTVGNPEYKNARFFGKGFVNKAIPKNLFFFGTNERNRSVLVPRNISSSYYNSNSSIIYTTSAGYELKNGFPQDKPFTLRPRQESFIAGKVQPYIDAHCNEGSLDMLLIAQCGSGKCHTKGTKILMYDGTIKNVEDIIIGDLLMGDDSTPRKVLSLATGQEECYDVEQNKGQTYGVNKSHILCLQNRVWGKGKYSKTSSKNYGEIIEITVEDYLKLSKYKQNSLYGYKVQVDYPESSLPLDPYFLGVWLGDGSEDATAITTDVNDKELVTYYHRFARTFGLGIRVNPNDNASNTYFFTNGFKGVKNPLREKLRSINVFNNKHIPKQYLINSRENRLSLLAGLIDTDGHVSRKGVEIIQKRLELSTQIEQLCNSLGYRVCRSVKTIKGVDYHRLYITGDLTEIPTLLPRKAFIKRVIEKDPMVNGISLRYRGVEDYYGFVIDGNHRYLLSDGTVTHNTLLSLYISNIYKKNTIICVTTKKIGEQFIKEIKTHFPCWSCGWANDGKRYDVTLGTYALLSGTDYTEQYFRSFGHLILDEFHRCGADTYNKILEKAPCKYRTSLTATFRRKDNLHKILRLHAGEMLEMDRDEQEAIIQPVLTEVEVNEDYFRAVGKFQLKYENIKGYEEVSVKDRKTKQEVDRGMVVSTDNGEVILNSSVTQTNHSWSFANHAFYPLGTISVTSLDTEVAGMVGRDDIIFELIRKCTRGGRKTIFLSKRKEQLYNLSKLLTKYGISNGVYVSEKDKGYKEHCAKLGMTIEEYVTYIFNECDNILGIDKLAQEGMDAPRFDTLIYGHAIKDVEQSIGRILRDDPTKQYPVAYYLIDNINCYRSAFHAKKVGAKQMFVSLGHRVLTDTTLTVLKTSEEWLNF